MNEEWVGSKKTGETVIDTGEEVLAFMSWDDVAGSFDKAIKESEIENNVEVTDTEMASSLQQNIKAMLEGTRNFNALDRADEAIREFDKAMAKGNREIVDEQREVREFMSQITGSLNLLDNIQ